MQPADQAEPVEPGLSLSDWHARLRVTHGYDLAMRLAGSMWFLFLAAFVARETYGEFVAGPVGWPVLLSRGLLAAFFLLMWALIITRLPALAQSKGLLPTFAAFVGTYMPWTIGLLGPPRHSVALNDLSACLLVAGGLLTVCTLLCLGRSFSLVPQARRVVRSGPYHWVRHPLYLSEEIAILGTLLQFLSFITVLVFLAHILVQIRRILYEEALLRRAFPEYVAYAASRWRLVPYVW